MAKIAQTQTAPRSGGGGGGGSADAGIIGELLKLFLSASQQGLSGGSPQQGGGLFQQPGGAAPEALLSALLGIIGQSGGSFLPPGLQQAFKGIGKLNG